MSMKLTKLQRYTAYCIMLHEIGKEEILMCLLVFRVFGINNRGFCGNWTGIRYSISENCGDITKVLEYFPELLKKRSKHYGWPLEDIEGLKERKKFIKQCIIETHP